MNSRSFGKPADSLPSWPSQLLSIREWIFPFSAAEMLLLPPPTPTLAHPATLVSAPEQAEDGDLDVTGGSVAGGERTWQSRGRWA